MIVSPFFLFPGRHWHQVFWQLTLVSWMIDELQEITHCEMYNKLITGFLQDIPTLTAEAAKEHPGVSYIITAPLGLHELLVVRN